MQTCTLAPRLSSLADRIHRLCPDHRDPEKFHIEKDDLATEVRRIAEYLTPESADRVYSILQTIKGKAA